MSHGRLESAPCRTCAQAAAALVLTVTLGCPAFADAQQAVSQLPVATESQAPPVMDVLDLAGAFSGFEGCFVLLDVPGGRRQQHNPQRCSIRFAPCSTFKVPNSLIGLEHSVVRDAGHVFKWDGRERRRAILNRDHDMRSAMRHSVLWYYQEVARGVGTARMAAALAALNYGNQDMSAGLTEFWLGGALAVSADEQVDLLRRLHGGTLPFSQRSCRIVLDIMVQKQHGGWILRGKTGSGHLGTGAERRGLGWFIGSVQHGDALWIFATNLEGDKANGYSVARATTLRILSDQLPQAPPELWD